MINDSDSLSRSVSQHDTNNPTTNLVDQKRQQSSSSCSSITSGIGQSDQSICNDRPPCSRVTDQSEAEHSDLANVQQLQATPSISPTKIEPPSVNNFEPNLRLNIKKFVESIFIDSQSISLEKKAEFGQLVRSAEARLLFAMFVDDYRVNSKRVSELTFYSLAQYFSIVLFECLLAEDFRPAKIIMNMIFTYYYEQNCDKNSMPSVVEKHSGLELGSQRTVRTYLYTLLKEQQIFKSIRFWTSAFYESVIIERNNHPVFFDGDLGKQSNERRDEELDCSKNITFGLLGSFIHNMSLLDLSHEFCQEFLDKHSTIAGLSDEQLEMLRANLENMFCNIS